MAKATVTRTPGATARKSASAKKSTSRRPSATKLKERADKLDKVHAQLHEKVSALVTAEDWKQFLTYTSRFRAYSWRNVLLILGQCARATQVAGYDAWAALGRQVMTGEKSLSILAPNMRVIDDEGAPDGKRRFISGWHTVGVFDISQTEGVEVTPPSWSLFDETPDGLAEAVIELIEEAGYFVTRGNTGDVAGTTTASTTTVLISDEISGAGEVVALIRALVRIHQITAGRDVSSELLNVEAGSIAHMAAHEFSLTEAECGLTGVHSWSGGDVKIVEQTANWVVKNGRVLVGDIAKKLASPSGSFAG
jgi:hypothetical protein